MNQSSDDPSTQTSASGNRPIQAGDVDTIKPSSTGAPGSSAGTIGSLPEIFGRYRINKKLGEGSMGSVYLAHDTQLDRPVALKVPRIAPQDDPKVLERFHREARAAALFRHTNLCPVYDVGEQSGIHYLTMAYVDGTPLNVLIRQGPPFSQHQAATLVRQLALALAYAHRHGVVHRDLKPSNIMMTAGHEPVIMDFGLARRADGDAIRLTQTGDIMGTPAYMPPEQVTGDLTLIGPVSDVYSLGVILYELLTGQLPFPGTLAHILAQIIVQEPPPPTKHRANLDSRLCAICMKAMAKKVEDRYPSMEAFAQALQGWLGSSIPEADARGSTTLVQAAAPATRPPSPRPQSRSWVPLALGMLLIGAVLMAATLFGLISLLGAQHGDLHIEINDPQAVVFVDGDALTVEKLRGPLRLRVGSHSVVVKRGDATMLTREVMVKPGENPVMKLEMPPSGGVASTISPIPVTPTGDGFVPLLSGKAIAGWEGINEYWHFEDGMLIGALPAKRISSNTFFCTKKKYRDFELRFQVKLKSGNSGLQIRSRVVDEDRFNVNGPQVEIGQMSKFPWGSLVTEPVVEPSIMASGDVVSRILRKDDFNDYYVKCVGKHVTIKLNNVTTVDEDFPSMADEGILALQLHHYFPEMEVQFRNFEIREIPPEPAGFKPLFNGKDLAGWSVDSGDPTAWYVENGELRLSSTAGGRGWLFTDKDYADYVLRFEVQMEEGANSGVALRAAPGDGPNFAAAKGGPMCLEVQLWDDHFPAYARQSILQQTGALYDLALDRIAAVKPRGEWNAVEVTVRGREVRSAINGTTVLQANLDHYLDRSKKIPGLTRKTGRIGLQNHSGRVRFRNMAIKELHSAAATLPTEDTFQPLLNGRNSDRWYIDHGDPFGWAVEGGTIIARGVEPVQNRGWLLSRQDYDNFVLRFDFKLSRGGNSGVTFRAAPGESRFIQGKRHVEIQILDDDDPALRGLLDPVQTTGAIYKVARTTAARLKPVGEWNQMEVMAWGHWLFVSVNGYRTLDVDLDDYAEQAENLPGLKRTTGRIGFQSWEKTVEFRNVRLRRLPAP